MDGRSVYNFKNSINHYGKYEITDYNGEEIQGSFYEQELKKTSQDVFRIEKLLNRRGDKSLVKWMRYSDAFNSWVDSKAIVEKYNIIRQ